jgi:hypothetical protein
MNGYSGNRAVTLEGIRPRHAYTLLEIVHGSTLRERSFVAGIYADTATHFEETLGFLERLGWLRSINGDVEPASDIVARIVAADGDQRSVLLAEALFEGAGPYHHAFARYLSQFRLADGELVHRPTMEARQREAGVRDFLMDLGAVTYRVDGDLFMLERPFAMWAVWARNVLSASAKQLARDEKQRLALGQDAELAVLEWEKKRVGNGLQHHVRHVSHENPAACFDIRSVTVVDAEFEPRCIEVKAVAAHSFEFHWSRSEIEAAEILGAKYYLYLVPVLGPRVFDLAHMEIVRDAYVNVYRNRSNWSMTVVDTVCRKRENTAS